MKVSKEYRIDCNGAYRVSVITLVGKRVTLGWIGNYRPIPQSYIDKYPENRTKA